MNTQNTNTNYQSYETTPQAIGQTAQTPPKPEKPKDPVQRLIQLQEQNQELLQTIAANSEIQIQTIKTQGRYKLYGTIAKYIFYGLIIYWSIAMTPKLIQGITNQMLGGITQQASGQINPDNIQNVLENIDLNAILGN